jgi:nitrate reductase NapE component
MSHIAEHYHTCKKHLNKAVRIITKQGKMYIGTIVKVDKNHVHLQLHSTSTGTKVHTKSFAVLTLVLFDLLAVFLLSTPFFI